MAAEGVSGGILGPPDLGCQLQGPPWSLGDRGARGKLGRREKKEGENKINELQVLKGSSQG